VKVAKDTVTLACTYSGQGNETATDAIIPVTHDSILLNLQNRSEEFGDHGIKSVEKIGDFFAPGIIAMATYAGHQYARQLDNPVCQKTGFKRKTISHRFVYPAIP
jgi:dimethylamine/trimethylamine dehydrogenase